YLVEAESDLGATTREAMTAGQPLLLRLQVPAEQGPAGGLSVFGSDTGAFPFDPTLVLTTERPLPADLGTDANEPVAVDRFSARLRYLLFSGDAAPDVEPRWSYTTREPAAGWQEGAFDDTGWPTGGAGFGAAGTPGLRVRTVWNTPAIWLRTKL